MKNSEIVEALNTLAAESEKQSEALTQVGESVGRLDENVQKMSEDIRKMNDAISRLQGSEVRTHDAIERLSKLFAHNVQATESAFNSLEARVSALERKAG